MSSDDEGLRWEGDDPPVLPTGFTAVGRNADAVGELHPDGTVTMPGDPASMSSAVLVTLGIVGGLFVLETIGWLLAGLRLAPASVFLVSTDGVAPPLWQAGASGAFALAVAAPAIWFAAAIVLTRAARPWVRIVVLLAGLVLLVPWPVASLGAL